MARVYKILGDQHQYSVSGGGAYIYTVPDAKAAAISCVSVCNPNATTANVVIHAVKAEDGMASAKNIIYSLPIEANQTFATYPMTLSNQDQIFVSCDTDDVAFTIFGAEFDQPNVFLP